VVHTYDKLLGHDAAASGGQAVKRKRFSMSLFVIYFGLKRKHPSSSTTPSSSARATRS
jgi:phytoene desaturase